MTDKEWYDIEPYPVKRNRRIKMLRIIGWATVFALLIGGLYIGLHKQEQIEIERNV